MENKGVLVGSIVFVFASFFLKIGLLAYESYKAKQRNIVASEVGNPTDGEQSAGSGFFDVQDENRR